MAKIQSIKKKKGTVYRVEFMRSAKRVSKTFKTKKEAEKFAATVLVDEDFANTFTNHTLTTLKFSEAVSLYLEEDQGKDLSKYQRLAHWVSVFQDKPVGKVTRQQVKLELKKLSEGRAPATLNRYKAALSSLYRYLSNEFDIDHNPVKGIPQYTENNARTRFLSNSELSRLLNVCKKSKWSKLYLLVLMA